LVSMYIYGFNIGGIGLTFLSLGVACMLGLIIYSLYLGLYLGPDIAKRGLRAPEHRLVPALFGVCSLPAGLFMFGTYHILTSTNRLSFLTAYTTGWTSRHGVHWIVSLIGVIIVVASNFIVFQCIFVYLPLS